MKILFLLAVLLFTVATSNHVRSAPPPMLGVQPSTYPTLSHYYPTHLPIRQTISTYCAATTRLILFDYDGTLTPIRQRPEDAVPSMEMLKAMEVLVSDPKNSVFVISGRDRGFLETWLGHIKGLGLSAEHGSFIKHPNQTGWISLLNDTDLSWKTEAKNIFNKCCASTPGSFIERKQTSVGWHYRLSSEETSELKAQECRKELETVIGKKYPDIHVTMGKKVIEVRPRGVNKGEIVKRLLLTKNGKFDWVICAGDDKTDEDMFSALEDASIMMDLQGVLTCSIGPSNKETIARLYLESPEDLISLMNHLALESQ